jgi:hypothetical protein
MFIFLVVHYYYIALLRYKLSFILVLQNEVIHKNRIFSIYYMVVHKRDKIMNIL